MRPTNGNLGVMDKANVKTREAEIKKCMISLSQRRTYIWKVRTVPTLFRQTAVPVCSVCPLGVTCVYTWMTLQVRGVSP